MKTLYLSLGTLFLSGLLATSGLAQRSPSRFSNYDAVTSLRIGGQSVGLGDLNQALQQAGYGSLNGQQPVVSITSQISRPDKALTWHSELGFALASKATNGSFDARGSLYYLSIGASYSLIRSERFQLGPQVGLSSVTYRLQLEPVKNASLPLNTILANPGSPQKTTLRSGSGGINAGLTASLRIPYGAQQQINCVTVNRSFVIGLDAGYRFAGRLPLDASHEIGSDNPAIQFSGWYTGLRLGFGQRVRSVK